MRPPNLIIVAVMLLVSPGASTVGAAEPEHQSLESIRDSVEAFILANRPADAKQMEVTVSALDSRLRLPSCTVALEPFLPPGRTIRGNVTVGVRCSGARPWSVYIPAKLETYLEVAVTRGPVTRGVALDAGDVHLEVREVGTLRDGYYTRIDEVVGMVARRAITGGATIRASMLTPPTLVRRGEQVMLVARSGTIQVRTEGRALGDGARGETIGVRNVRSNRVVEGTVVSPGVVEVTF